jgi:hypothetical protein
MNTEVIRKLQATLLNIKNGNDVFFNVAQYESLGLVKAQKSFTGRLDSKGNRMMKTKFVLTNKAHTFINVAI